jgi:plasmid stabilization system protein ParE
MSAAFFVTPAARQDLLATWRYIADTAGDRIADQVLTTVRQSFERVAETPSIGHFRPDLVDERHRLISVASLLVIYRWETRPVQIIRVLHGSRDVRRIMSL